MNEMLQLSLLGGQSVQLVDVEFTELLNVDRSTILVGTVIELGVVLVDLGLFRVVESIAKCRKCQLKTRRQRQGVKTWSAQIFTLPLRLASFRLTQQYHPYQIPSSIFRWLPT